MGGSEGEFGEEVLGVSEGQRKYSILIIESHRYGDYLGMSFLSKYYHTSAKLNTILLQRGLY